MIRLLSFPPARFSAALLLSIASASMLSAQTDRIAGTWTGEIAIPGQKLGIDVVLKNEGGWNGTYDIPAQRIDDFPLEDIVIALPDVSFVLGGGVPGEPTFSLRMSSDGGRLEGNFSQSGATFPAHLKRVTGGGEDRARLDPAATIEAIRAFVEKAREDWDIPGMAVAIVRGNEIVFAEGFGKRNVEKNLSVTASTQFAIGSTTKAFTSVIIGTLVDEGKLAWDEPVISYMPDFRLHDEYATMHLTVRDLLLHVSGLPRHDLLWYGTDLNRGQLYERLRFLEPTAALRQRWQYQNLMYMTAGILAERISGKTWEELVRERIFEPLGMNDATLSVAAMQHAKDFSQPYAKDSSGTERIDFRSLDAIAPAGAINAGVDEMAAWLRMNLNGGEFEGARVISEETLREIHDPAVVIAGETGVEGLHFNLYAMGWMVSSYRGHRLLHHGGGIDGFVSHVALLPDDGIGIVVLTNMPTGLPEIAMLDIADRMLGLEPLEHTKGMLAQMDAIKAGESPDGSATDVARVKGTRPTYALNEYEGTYEHPAYGRVHIVHDGSSLQAIHFGDTLDLEHYHYDVFRAGDGAGASGSALVSFQPDVRGGVAALTVPLEPALDPIRFDKLPAQQLRDPAYLKRFLGTYELSTQNATVGLRDSSLTISLPGQPLYTLDPGTLKPGEFAEFSIEGLAGFNVRFEEEGGGVRRMIFLQPNGTFVARKR